MRRNSKTSKVIAGIVAMLALAVALTTTQVPLSARSNGVVGASEHPRTSTDAGVDGDAAARASAPGEGEETSPSREAAATATQTTAQAAGVAPVDGDVAGGYDVAGADSTHDASDASVEAGPYGPEDAPCEEFVMPEEALYEPNVALVEVDPEADAGEVSAALASLDGVRAVSASADDVASGFVRVELAEGVTVEDAVNELAKCDVAVQAQPNYLYRVADLMEDVDAESAELQAEADEAEADAGEAEPGAAGAEDSVAAMADDTAGQAGDDQEPAADEVLSASQDEGTMGPEPVDAPELASVPEAGQEPTDAEPAGAEPTTADPVAPEATEPASTEPEPATVQSAADDDQPMADEDAATQPTGDNLAPEAVSVSDPRAKSQWALSSIGAYDAWGISKANRKVCVAVMDMGFDLSHPDLKANIVKPYNSMENKEGPTYLSGNASDVQHGTHVTGIISAVSNNGMGVSGVSYNAWVMPIKIGDSTGVASSESFVRAFAYVRRYAEQYNIRIINMSVGSDMLSIETMLKDKIASAYKAGIVTVASAGNFKSKHSTPYAHYPSDLPDVVGVISLEKSGKGVRKAELSNYNRSNSDGKDISAPGSGVLSTGADGTYVTLSGTSMAAPHVSGVLALEFAVNPKLSAEHAVDILYQTATDLGDEGWDKLYGWGEANAYAAVRAAKDSLDEARANVSRTTSTYTVSKPIASAIRAELATLRANQAAAKAIRYRTHVQTYGWQAWKSAGATSGTSGESKRLEGICIKLVGAPYAGSIQYRTHVQTYGWQGWRQNGAISGTSGESKRLEAISIRLTGEMAKRYDVWYRVHAQTFGWMGWAKDGALAGTEGYSKRLEGIQIKVLPKGSAAPGATSFAFRKA